MAVRRRHIRSLVERLLDTHSIQCAPVPVERLALASGLQIQREPAENDLSGFLIRNTKTQQALIGINSNHAPTRQAFTLAHELGHFLLHDTDRVHVDRSETTFHVRLRNDISRDGTDEEEIEANVFAAELLMPVRLLQKDLVDADALDLVEESGASLQTLALKYGVSTQALTFRLANLGYIQL